MFAVSVLSSGSTANATYVKAGQWGLLFDAGLPRKTLFSRLASIGVDPDEIDAMFLTHEHSDHIRGAGAIQRALDIPLYASDGTILGAGEALKGVTELRAITGSPAKTILDPLAIDDVLITPVRVPHDALSPLNYVVEYKGKRLGIHTDLGRATSAVTEIFPTLDCAVLELNHCVDMLWQGQYPVSLKQRIASPTGHLSNQEAASLLIEHGGPKLSALFLAHRSKSNNTPEEAYRVAEHARQELLQKGHADMALLHTSHSAATGLIQVGSHLSAEEIQQATPDLDKEKPASRRRKQQTLDAFAKP